MENVRTKPILFIKVLLFSASIIPVFVSGALTHYNGIFNIYDFISLMLALFLGQAAGDYLYYYFTHFHTDARDSHTKIFAGWKPFFGSFLEKKKYGILSAASLCLLIDLGFCCYFYSKLGMPIIYMSLAGALIAVSFTWFMLKGFKELIIFITFGPLITVSAYYALTGRISMEAFWASLPLGFFITAVAYLKGAKFIVKKSEAGDEIINLRPTRLIILYTLAYLTIIVCAELSIFPIYSLSALISLPLALSIVYTLSRKIGNINTYLWATVKSIVILIISGLLIAASFFWS